MKPLKKIIGRYMNLVTLILITVLTIIIVSFQVADAHRQAYKDAVTTLQQIDQCGVPADLSVQCRGDRLYDPGQSHRA